MKTTTRKRVSKGKRQALAQEVLANEGVQSIRIERLARDLKIAKKGFYLHFARSTRSVARSF